MGREMLSVIVPCRGLRDDFIALLDSLAEQAWDGPWEVVVADNGARDDLRALAAVHAGKIPEVRVIDATGRRGAAHARNRGVEEARGGMLAFIDADDLAGAGWVAAMAAGLREHRFVASRFDYERLNHGSAASCLFGNPQARAVQVLSYSPFMRHAGGCGMGIRRALHEQVGGFDESMAVCEETDYCIRVQRQCGVELAFLPEAVVMVRLRSSTAGMARQQFRWACYNVRIAKVHGAAPGARQGAQMWWAVGWRWLRLWWRLARIRRRSQWAGWVRSAAWNSGLLAGAVRWRTAPPIV